MEKNIVKKGEKTRVINLYYSLKKTPTK